MGSNAYASQAEGCGFKSRFPLQRKNMPLRSRRKGMFYYSTACVDTPSLSLSSPLVPLCSGMPKNKRARKLALIRAQVGTRGHVKKRGKNPAFVLFSARYFRLGIRLYGQSQATLPVRLEKPHIPELPEFIHCSAMKIIAQILLSLTAFKVRCQNILWYVCPSRS